MEKNQFWLKLQLTYLYNNIYDINKYYFLFVGIYLIFINYFTNFNYLVPVMIITTTCCILVCY